MAAAHRRRRFKPRCDRPRRRSCGQHLFRPRRRCVERSVSAQQKNRPLRLQSVQRARYDHPALTRLETPRHHFHGITLSGVPRLQRRGGSVLFRPRRGDLAAQRQSVRRAPLHREGTPLRIPAPPSRPPPGRDRRAERVRLRPTTSGDVWHSLQRTRGGRRKNLRPGVVARRCLRRRRIPRQDLAHETRQNCRRLCREERPHRRPRDADHRRRAHAAGRFARRMPQRRTGLGHRAAGTGQAVQTLVCRPGRPATGARLRRESDGDAHHFRPAGGASPLEKSVAAEHAHARHARRRRRPFRVVCARLSGGEGPV